MRLYSLSHSFGGIILSSTTPFFSMLLWQNFKSLSLTLSFFIFLLIILMSTMLVLRRMSSSQSKALLHSSKNLLDVIPAKAGIQKNNFNIDIRIYTCDKVNIYNTSFYMFYWIPAYAGMT